MRDLFLLLFVLGMVPVTFVRPQLGLMIWAWISYMNPHRLTWSYAYDFRFNYLIAIATLLGILLNKNIRIKILLTPITFFWGMFILWTFFTYQFAINPNAAYLEMLRFYKIQVMIVVTFILINDKIWINRLVTVIVLSIGFWGVKGGLFTIIHGGINRVYGPMYSFIEDNNSLALAVVMTIPYMGYLYRFSTKWFVRLGWLSLIIVCFASVLGSYSRGGLVGAIILTISFWQKSPRKILVGFAFLLGMYNFYIFMPAHWHERMDALFMHDDQVLEDASVSGRFVAWNFALAVVKERPFVGGGFHAFSSYSFSIYAPGENLHDAHSIYFEIIAEQGWVGFVLYICMYLLTYLKGMTIRISCRGHPDLKWAADLGSMIQVSLLGYATCGIFLGMAYFDLPYHFLSIMVILGEVVKNEIKNKNIGGRRTVPKISSSLFFNSEHNALRAKD
ncbi:MAG: putative O-glycosylation ligase, exosortase A system-associated [Magnetococcus sp. DMHC-6]